MWRTAYLNISNSFNRITFDFRILQCVLYAYRLLFLLTVLVANMYKCFSSDIVCYFVFCVSTLSLLSYFKPPICVINTVFCVYKLLLFNFLTCQMLPLRLLCVKKASCSFRLLTYLVFPTSGIVYDNFTSARNDFILLSF